MPAPEAPALSVGSEHEVRFIDLLPNGQGVARIGGLVAFVWGPLPGERARIRLVEIKKPYAVGETVEMLEHSPDRVVPFCPVFGTCGGCQVQHLAYPAQLAWKSRVLEDALERIGGLRGARVEPTIGMDDPRAYRNKMALVVKHLDDHAEFGFYQMRSHDFVPIAGCPVVLPQLDEQISALRKAATEPELAPAFRDVRHVIARAGARNDAKRLVARNRCSICGDRCSGAATWRKDCAGSSASAIPSHQKVPMRSWAKASRRLGQRRDGRAHRRGRHRRGPVPGVMPHRSFKSTGDGRRASSSSLASLPQPRKLIDLYCGTGTFSIWFALRGADVVGIEESPSAIREARTNAELNGVAERTRFLHGRVEDVLARNVGTRGAARRSGRVSGPAPKGKRCTDA